MIDDSKKKTFDYVLVYQLDRFARNRYDSANYKAKLKKNGVRVLVVDAHIVQAVDYAFRFLSVFVTLKHIFYNRRFYGVYSPTLVHDVIWHHLHQHSACDCGRTDFHSLQ